MTRKILLNMLENVTREDQPVLKRIGGDYWGTIALCVNSDQPIPLRRVNLSLEDGWRRFGTEWVKYNKWLHYWYLGKSLGPIAANTNEHRTQLRAAGYGDERVEKTIEDLRADRLSYEKYKKVTERKRQ